MPSATEVNGLRIHAESGGGTLHAQCVLRGFGSPNVEEVTMRRSIATPGTVDLMFPEPLVINRSFVRCSVDPWQVWRGEAPLVLAAIPTMALPVDLRLRHTA